MPPAQHYVRGGAHAHDPYKAAGRKAKPVVPSAMNNYGWDTDEEEDEDEVKMVSLRKKGGGYQMQPISSSRDANESRYSPLRPARAQLQSIPLSFFGVDCLLRDARALERMIEDA